MVQLNRYLDVIENAVARGEDLVSEIDNFKDPDVNCAPNQCSAVSDSEDFIRSDPL